MVRGEHSERGQRAFSRGVGQDEPKVLEFDGQNSHGAKCKDEAQDEKARGCFFLDDETDDDARDDAQA